MVERSTPTIDSYQGDVKGFITGGFGHVNPIFDEQCCHHRPLGQATPVRESSHKYFVRLGVNRDRTGYLSVAPEVHDAASPALHSSTRRTTKLIALIISITAWPRLRQSVSRFGGGVLNFLIVFRVNYIVRNVFRTMSSSRLSSHSFIEHTCLRVIFRMSSATNNTVTD